MKRYRFSVCKGPDCRRGGADAVYRAAQEQLKNAGLNQRCHLFRGGCYGLCDLGPNVVIREEVGRPKDPLSREDFQLMGWDDEVYYGAMTVEKLARIIAEHIREGCPVEEFRGSHPILGSPASES